MQNSLRLFIAVELSKDIHSQLSMFIEELKKDNWKIAKWVRPENMHLTMKFLGDTDKSKIPQVKEAIADACGPVKQFNLVVTGTGVFPSRKNPRVLWAGLSADDSLNRLYLGLEEEMAKLGYNKENRPFSPHLTLTRIPYLADETAMEATLKHLFAARDREFGSVMVRRITLFQSTLAAGGSIYSPLAFFQLHE